ncbi:N-acetyltransferase [Burkholderia sp. SFA1]|uniref:Acetyltransferase n=1 Tax=Caballeronia cordobensis TaxID=1353886 RepID=A0A158HCH7_CABCO|nr:MULTISPECIES: GNAT family N-acetyltransferase [Caballeronia]MCE4544205.1 GNAT family N-acetyltransferase [Caballeronia sp. PC1]MCE4571356.1 GNAT family N-acetyltransferase [Caballeronia sp. CLC5]BBP98730.1 N-acetyltransferase [Burkholderia sp. SFA1]SAL41671.1 acetyltransferase [Caballeronia cordobensis]
MSADVTLAITDWIDATFEHDVAGGLAAFNRAQLGPSHQRDLAVSLYRDDDFLGGLAGFTAWDWLFVKWLWIREDARRAGLGTRALAAAENEAIKRGCRAAWLDTVNPAAHALYARCGYETFGELADFHAGKPRYFMQKRF